MVTGRAAEQSLVPRCKTSLLRGNGYLVAVRRIRRVTLDGNLLNNIYDRLLTYLEGDQHILLSFYITEMADIRKQSSQGERSQDFEKGRKEPHQ